MMKKSGLIILMFLFSSGFASVDYADQFEVQYHYYKESKLGDCPKTIKKLVEKKQPLSFIYFTEDYNAVQLMDSSTKGVSIADRLLLANEGLSGMQGYMSTAATALQVAKKSYELQQVWLLRDSEQSPWQSGFYLGKNRECLVATDQIAAKNFLAKLRVTKNN